MTNDLISREALMEFAHNHINGTIDCNDIARFPAVDAAPVAHGWWEWREDYRNYAKTFRCSACKSEIEMPYYTRGCDYDFCPNCGARMDKEE